MKKRKIKLKDLSENVLLPETSFDLVTNGPLSADKETVRFRDENKNLAVNAPTVYLNNNDSGALNLKGSQLFRSNKTILVGKSNFRQCPVDPSSFENFPAMSVFGLIQPKETSVPENEWRWRIFGMRVDAGSENGKKIYKIYGYCTQEGDQLVPDLSMMEITNFDNYSFVPLCSSDFNVGFHGN